MTVLERIERGELMLCDSEEHDWMPDEEKEVERLMRIGAEAEKALSECRRFYLEAESIDCNGTYENGLLCPSYKVCKMVKEGANNEIQQRNL